MQESKLISSLKELDKKARQRFKTYVNSPYFNQHKKTIELLDYILKHLDKRPKKLAREQVFKNLFPGDKYSEQAVFNVMSSLKKLFHSFLAQQRYESKTYDEDLYLLDAAYNGNHFSLLKNRAKQFEKKLKNCAFHDHSYYYANYRYLVSMAYYDTQFEDRSKTGRLQQLTDNLDRFYLLEKLRHSIELTSNQILMNSQFDFSFLDEVLAYYRQEEERFAKDYSIRLHYTILMSLRDDENPVYYQELKKTIQEDIHLYSPQEQRDLYSHANNYCVRQINKGKREFQKELFDLYKEGLRTELIFANDILNEWNYKNITVLGCQLQEFEWTASFLENYRSKLPPNQRENSYNYNMAHLNFSEQRYNEALDHLLLVRFSDVKYHLNYNNLLLRIYFALGDTEALMSLIDTFRIYVIRNRKMTTEQKKQYNNFLRFTKKLTSIKQQPRSYGSISKQEEFAHLYLQIRDSRNIVNRYWLEKTCREEAGTALEQLLEENV